MSAIPSTYDTQAADFLDRFKLSVTIQLRTPESCPPWDYEGLKVGRDSCPRCGAVHGREYLVTVGPAPGTGSKRRPLSFAYWGAHADRPNPGAFRSVYMQVREWEKGGKHPTAYDVLACLASDASCPDTADAVVEEFGDMKPSRAEAIAAHGNRVRAYFTSAELDALAEIQ